MIQIIRFRCEAPPAANLNLADKSHLAILTAKLNESDPDGTVTDVLHQHFKMKNHFQLQVDVLT